MLISEIIELLEGTLIYGDELLEQEIVCACGSDLMSDVLAFGGHQGILVTGLVNPQVVRTAEMMDIKCIVFGRGKKPTLTMIDLAAELSIVLLSTKLGMLNCCGLLYRSGLREEG